MAAAKKSVSDLSDADLKGKKVLIRCDLNVPLDGKKITDDTRIRASVPTIKYLLEKGAKVAISSHLGRPKVRPRQFLFCSLQPYHRSLSPTSLCSTLSPPTLQMWTYEYAEKTDHRGFPLLWRTSERPRRQIFPVTLRRSLVRASRSVAIPLCQRNSTQDSTRTCTPSLWGWKRNAG